MADWNFDMSQAPRSKKVFSHTVALKKGGNPTGETKDIYKLEKDVIIAASKCGKVTASYYIPDEDRWCMFAKGELPIAWQPWPEHPHAD